MTKPPESLRVGFLFDDTLDSDDGVAQYVKTLGAYLADHGHKVTYLIGQTKLKTWHDGKVYSLSRNLKIKWGGNSLSMPLFSKKRRIKNALSANEFDVIHVQVPYSPFMAQRLINYVSGDTAIVGTVHVYPANRLAVLGSKILRLIYGRSLKKFNSWISVSSAAQAYAKEAFKIEPVIVPNVVEARRFKVQSQSQPFPTVVFLGRLVERKGCLQLLKAFNVLHRAMPEARLKIAGRGPLRPKLEKYVRDNKLGDVVEFWGYVSEADKPKLLASADIACFPSLYGESFGIVLIEAMAAGAKVVMGGDNPGYKSVLGQRPELLVDPNNTNQFADRLYEFLSDKSRQNAAHDWAQSEVKKYDIEVVGPRIEKLYTEAIARLPKTGHNKAHE